MVEWYYMMFGTPWQSQIAMKSPTPLATPDLCRIGKEWYPLVNKHSYWKWPSRNSGFTHWKCWFPIVMLVYQRVNTPGLSKPQDFTPKSSNCHSLWTPSGSSTSVLLRSTPYGIFNGILMGNIYIYNYIYNNYIYIY